MESLHVQLSQLKHNLYRYYEFYAAIFGFFVIEVITYIVAHFAA